jgi:Family of unknown function (DUF5906)
MWLKWQNRYELRKIAYEPGQPRITAAGCLNSWTGWGCEPIQGDMEWWHLWMEMLFGKATASRKYFEQWLAYPLQNPGVKMFVAALLCSVEQGVGKSFLGEMVGRIYGVNFKEVDKREFHKNFNSWAAKRQFILGNEVSSKETKREDMDTIKNLITRETVTIDKKFVQPYDVRDCINYLFTSNHPDAFPLEKADRRTFVWEVISGRVSEKDATLWRQLKESGVGPSRLFYYLLNIDLAGFNPFGAPPMTDAKRRMITESASPAMRLVEELYASAVTTDEWNATHKGERRHHPLFHSRWAKPGVDVYDSAAVAVMYVDTSAESSERSGINKISLGRAFATFNKSTPKGRGFPEAVLEVKGTTVHLYALRDHARWHKSKPADWRKNTEAKPKGGKI